MNRARLWRLVILAVVLIALVVVRYGTSFGASVSTTRIRGLVQAAGFAGVAIYLVIFAIGELLHVPGLVFVAAAVMSWGHLGGGVIAYAGALVSVTLSFFVVRGIGGQALAELKWRWVQKVMARLDERPILTVALLRLTLWIAPALNYALALSRIRYRDYLIGSAIGLALPIAGASLFFQYLLR